MTRRLALLVFVVVLGWSAVAQAQQWAGILAPSRAIDWSIAGVTGGIPTTRTQCGAPIAAYTGSATTINNAIANCGPNQYVQLGAGTFSLSSSILFNNKSNVTLRGMGADQTKLRFTGANSCAVTSYICIKNGDMNNQDSPTHTANWTGGYAKGTTQITLSNTTGLSAGMILLLDQLDDASDGYPAPGDIFVCAQAGGCVSQGTSAGRPGRGQIQIVTVQSVAGNTVTISPGLYMPNWRADRSPGAWWPGSTVSGVGLEDFALDGTSGAAVCSGCGSIFMFNARDSWIKGIRSLVPNNTSGQPIQAHVRNYITAHITIRDSYFHGGDNSSQSYGIETFIGSDLLYENNMFNHLTGPVVLNGSDVGSVIAYNYAIDNNYTAGGTSPGWMQPMVIWHSSGQSMILMEGNQGQGVQTDNIHGTHHFGTFFRNHWFGDIYNNPPKTSNTEIIHLWKLSRFFNVIGNVLGRTGYYNTYEASSATAVFSVEGNPDSQGGPSDARVKATLMRWGNYDTVTGAARWLASEVPTGIPNYSNAVPASQTLPASFYLSGKPTWWGGSVPWPAIGPDVTGGNISGFGGHAYKIPARLCYETAATDGAYADGLTKVFNAASCYYGKPSVSVPPAQSIIGLQ